MCHIPNGRMDSVTFMQLAESESTKKARLIETALCI